MLKKGLKKVIKNLKLKKIKVVRHKNTENGYSHFDCSHFRVKLVTQY